MSTNKMMQAYKSSDREAVAESNDPLEIVVLIFDELVRNMQEFVRQSQSEAPNAEARSKHFSRALTLIYALQSSLNFEQGCDIANNLFRLYEFTRQQMMQDWKGNTVERTEKAIAVIDDIRDAWHQISRKGVAE